MPWGIRVVSVTVPLVLVVSLEFFPWRLLAGRFQILDSSFQAFEAAAEIVPNAIFKRCDVGPQSVSGVVVESVVVRVRTAGLLHCVVAVILICGAVHRNAVV